MAPKPTLTDAQREQESDYRKKMLQALWRMRVNIQTENSLLDLDALMWAIGLCAREEAAHVHSE